VYALYTVKALGGGAVLLSTFHWPAWDIEMAESMMPFLRHQEYIDAAGIFSVPIGQMERWRACGTIPKGIDTCSFNLWKAETDHNPEAFPEWHGRVWPGNCHIAKRYAVHFGVEWDPESKWLTAPTTKKVDVIFHMPLRRIVRNRKQWFWILNRLQETGYSVIILGGPNDIDEWSGRSEFHTCCPKDFLETADYINSAKLFIGGASSCNTVAEGLKKRRIVELAPDCDDTYPYGDTGHYANDMSDEKIVQLALEILNG